MRAEKVNFGPGTVAIRLHGRPLAYVETAFSGLIPCRVIGAAIVTDTGPHVRAPASPGQIVLAVRYTAARGAYKRGDSAVWGIGQIKPRDSIRLGPFGYHVRAYSWAQHIPELAELI